jgi:hypothetical protein
MTDNPIFIGQPCTGPDPGKAARHRDDARASQILADFYELPESEQRIVAAASEQLIFDSKMRGE